MYVTSKNLHEQKKKKHTKKTDVDVFISKEMLFLLCPPFLPHSKQNVLKQTVFFHT